MKDKEELAIACILGAGAGMGSYLSASNAAIGLALMISFCYGRNSSLHKRATLSFFCLFALTVFSALSITIGAPHSPLSPLSIKTILNVACLFVLVVSSRVTVGRESAFASVFLITYTVSSSLHAIIHTDLAVLAQNLSSGSFYNGGRLNALSEANSLNFRALMTALVIFFALSARINPFQKYLLVVILLSMVVLSFSRGALALALLSFALHLLSARMAWPRKTAFLLFFTLVGAALTGILGGQERFSMQDILTGESSSLRTANAADLLATVSIFPFPSLLEDMASMGTITESFFLWNLAADGIILFMVKIYAMYVFFSSLLGRKELAGGLLMLILIMSNLDDPLWSNQLVLIIAAFLVSATKRNLSDIMNVDPSAVTPPRQVFLQ